MEQAARSANLGIWTESPDDEDEEDIGREVLVLRELAGKNVDAFLTRAGD
jgi:hypothetical protein